MYEVVFSISYLVRPSLVPWCGTNVRVGIFVSIVLES